MSLIRKIMGWIVLAPVALGALALAVANRAPVVLTWNPFEAGDGLEVPLFVLAFAAFVLGTLAGGLTVWTAQGKWRREARRQRAEIRQLRREKPEKEAEAVPVPQR